MSEIEKLIGEMQTGTVIVRGKALVFMPRWFYLVALCGFGGIGFMIGRFL